MFIYILSLGLCRTYNSKRGDEDVAASFYYNAIQN